MGAEAPQQIYTRQHVLRLLDITERQLAAWEREQLVPAGDAFSFSDLIVLRTLAQLRESGIPVLQIRRAVDSIRERIQEVRDPLAELKIVTDGKKLQVLVAGQKMEPLSGQLVMDFDRAELSKLVHFPPAPAPGTSAKELQRQRAEAEVLFEQAVQMEQTGAPAEQIIATYEEAARLDPTSSGAYVNLGTLHFNARKWRDAEKYYKKALEISPDYALAHFNLGNLYDERGERSKAQHHYERAVTLRPTYADAHYNLALLYQTIGQPLRAVSHWQTFLRLDGASSWAQIARRELEKLRRTMVVSGNGR